MGDIFGTIVFIGGAVMLVRYVYHGIFGTCPHCGSGDIIPDNGVFFYCNGCKRKH